MDGEGTTAVRLLTTDNKFKISVYITQRVEIKMSAIYIVVNGVNTHSTEEEKS